MEAVLSKLGLPPRFTQMIMALYSVPTARIRVNGRLSNAFSIENGTRQGCPLSPLIFIFTMEPLLRKLRDNPNIQGIDIPGKHCKIAAEDILLFLSSPITTIPNLLLDFQLFSTISNLKINFGKSLALNVSLPAAVVALCKQNFPFRWDAEGIRYLGINITPNLTDLYKANFLPTLHTIKEDLLKWQRGSFSWFGRAAILKMNVLPRILYLMQAIQIKLPLPLFTSLKGICRTFLWAGRPPRLSWDKLVLPKLKGGLGLPDPALYHKACLLVRLVDRHLHADKDWVAVENEFLNFPISHLPWISTRVIPRACMTHPLIGPTLLTFKALC